MGYRVVSTKLNEEEHTKLLDECNKHGCTPFALVKEAIMAKIDNQQKPVEKIQSGRRKQASRKICWNNQIRGT